jgi:K+-transporting ATPase A subunit
LEHRELTLNIITITTITIRILIPTAMGIPTTMGLAMVIPTTVAGLSAVLGVDSMSMASMAGSVGMAGLATASAVVDPMEVDSMAAAVDFTAVEASMVGVADFMEEVEAVMAGKLRNERLAGH